MLGHACEDMATLPAETLIGNANQERRGNASSADACAGEVDAQHRLFRHRRFVETVLALIASSLVAGTNITISPNSAGQLVISSSGSAGGVTSFNTPHGRGHAEQRRCDRRARLHPSSSRTTAAPGSPSDGDRWFSIPTPAPGVYINDPAPRHSRWS